MLLLILGFVVVGFAGGSIPSPALNHALVKNYSILGLHWGLYNTKNPKLVQHCHEQLTELAARGAIKPLVSERVVPGTTTFFTILGAAGLVRSQSGK